MMLLKSGRGLSRIEGRGWWALLGAMSGEKKQYLRVKRSVGVQNAASRKAGGEIYAIAGEYSVCQGHKMGLESNCRREIWEEWAVNIQNVPHTRGGEENYSRERGNETRRRRESKTP